MESGIPADAVGRGPGVSFYFECARCGNCCSNGTGVVWVEPDETAALAAALGMSEAAFARRYLREVDGRLSLVEERPGGGRCALLEGRNHCSVYGARPRHCRTFPFWPSILEGGDAFERARGLCAGMHEAPPAAARARAYEALDHFYQSVDARVGALAPRCEISGRCCDFPVAGHRLFATWLEVDSAVERGPRFDGAQGPGWCEFYRDRKCEARAVRPLACRTYFCDATKTEALIALHETCLRELHALERSLGYPHGYGDFVELLPARRRALARIDGTGRVQSI